MIVALAQAAADAVPHVTTTDTDTTRVWTFVFVLLTFMTYLYIGWRSRVRETRGFYVAGQGVPAIANGAATAADWMSAASFISMAGLISFAGSDGSVFLIGWTGGYVLLALLLAPYLRKFGKYTVPDFVGERYYSETARIVAAVCALFVSFTYVAGQMRGVGIVFSQFLGVDIWWGVFIGMVIVAFFAVLGGMKGITWTQVVQYGVLIFAFLVPAFAIAQMLTGNPVPQLSMTFSDIAEKLNGIQQQLGFNEYTQPFGQWNKLNVLCITAALMLGTAGLPHVIVRFYTVPNVRAARFSAGWALLFIAVLYTTAPALAIFARYNLLDSLNGATISHVEEKQSGDATRQIMHLTDSAGRPIDWAASWQDTGLMTFNDADGDGRISMNTVLDDDGNPTAKFAEATIDRDIIVLATPEVARLAPWVVALVVAGGLAAALSTAAGLLLVISSSIAHDLYIHFVEPNASERRRVLVGRIAIVGALIIAGYFGVRPPGFVGEVVAFAFGLAAASFFPIILLGIFDARTNREGAVLGMIVGLAFTAVYILGNTAHKILPGVEEPWFGHWCFGISPLGIGAVGMALNLIVTLVVSRLTPAPPQKVRRLVESVRVPAGAHPPEAHFDESDAEALDA
ncbi:MAG: cation acetate symporter [Planctomycetaceae bacterium]|nr:cation acetate symporter [Planctomycetaceae bacterium]